PVSLLALWTNRITVANSRKHQEFAGRASSVNNKTELYQHLKDDNGPLVLQESRRPRAHGVAVHAVEPIRRPSGSDPRYRRPPPPPSAHLVPIDRGEEEEEHKDEEADDQQGGHYARGPLVAVVMVVVMVVERSRRSRGGGDDGSDGGGGGVRRGRAVCRGHGYQGGRGGGGGGGGMMGIHAQTVTAVSHRPHLGDGELRQHGPVKRRAHPAVVVGHLRPHLPDAVSVATRSPDAPSADAQAAVVPRHRGRAGDRGVHGDQGQATAARERREFAQQELHQGAPRRAQHRGQAAGGRGGESVAGSRLVVTGGGAAELHGDGQPVGEALPVAGHQDQPLRGEAQVGLQGHAVQLRAVQGQPGAQGRRRPAEEPHAQGEGVRLPLLRVQERLRGDGVAEGDAHRGCEDGDGTPHL
ncbi:hypothetical protein CRUP_015940, partial [Coryphaenoides rupestris]